MLGMTEIPTYRIHTPGSPGEAELLTAHGLSREQVETALFLYAAREGAVVGAMLGVSVDGVIFTPVADWLPHTTTDDGFTDITIVPWAEIKAMCS